MGRIPAGPEVPRTPIGMLQMASALKSDMFAFIGKRLQTYGDVYALQVPGGLHYIVANPDFAYEMLVGQPQNFYKDTGYKDPKVGLTLFLGNGLLTSDGDFWKKQRKQVAPALHAKRIEAYAETMVESTDLMLTRWHAGSVLNIDREMMRLTLGIVAKTLFNADISAQAGRIGHILDTLQAAMMPLDVLPAWVPTPLRFRRDRAIAGLDEIVYGMINAWREQGADRGDLLSMLMLAQDDDGNHMTDKQIRDEAVTLLLAGHETTANTLNWTFLLLAQNPDVEAKLHDELDSVLGGALPTLADLKRLPYTEMVIKESMRLLPPAYSFGRQAIVDTEIAGYSIPKGTEVTVFSYFIHRDPRFWSEPERFMPERFSPENEKHIPRYAYLPFGGGPRICIGNSFASMEARLLLATIAQRFQLRLKPGFQVEFDPLITLRPKHGLMMTLAERTPERHAV